MIISEGYSIMQEPKKNRIIINLPQTVATMNTTTEPLSQRYLTITEGQEAAILGIVKAMYEGREVEKMQLSKEDTTFAREGTTFAREGIEINLNDFIKVKLNDRGKDVYRLSLFGQDPKVDENGYTEFQLWVFMNIYGAHIGMTDPPILETMNVLYGYERG